MTTRETIQHMLERWHDYTDPGLGSKEGGGDGHVPLTLHDTNCRLHHGGNCTCWARSFTELERCLRQLRATHRSYMHLKGRYFLSTTRQGTLTYRNGKWQDLDKNETVRGYDTLTGRSGPRTLPSREYQVIITRWPSWVSLAEVDVALDKLEACVAGELPLPADYFKTVAA